MKTTNKALLFNLTTIYMDWINNYLTVDKMAQDYGATPQNMEALIQLAREMYHKEYN